MSGESHYLFGKIKNILSGQWPIFAWLIAADRFTTAQKYVLTVLILAGLSMLTWVLRNTLGTGYTYILYYSGLMFAALIGGIRLGLLATIASAVAVNYFFIYPRTSRLISDPLDAVALLIFCFNGFLMTIMADQFRRAKSEQARQETLKIAHQELEMKVQERTEELQKAYDNLVEETRQRKQAEEQLRQAHKMEAIGGLAGGIAHDFNNMLAVIAGNAELALDDIKERGPRENVNQILDAAKRSRDLVRQILTFGRKSQGEQRPVKLGGLVEETAKLLRGTLPSTIKIQTYIEIDSDIVLADPSQIQQVLMNLSTNAAHAMREHGGALTISLSNVTFGEQDRMPDADMEPGRYVELSVRDTGSGMSKKIRHRIFDPFFTTKQPGEGTGMGLSVVFGIVKGHRGAITVKSEVGKGSIFNIFFPESPEPVEEERPQGENFSIGKETILLVDDEPSVLEAVSQMLRRLGYGVATAGSGPEGWKKFAENPDAFDLVITDHVMPEIAGMRLAERMLAMRADLPIILFTGYSETASPEKARTAGIRGFLTKPIMKEQLAEMVRRVLDSRNIA